jgi:murein DD-endopeptidase MepM/ murein hydrolase activator NlpD
MAGKPMASINIRTTTRHGTAAALACALALAGAGAAQAQTTPSPEAPPPTEEQAASSQSAAPKGTQLLQARAAPRRAYTFGLKQVRFTIALSKAADVQIDVVRGKSRALERRMAIDDVPARTPTSVTWDGLSGSGTAVRGRLRLVVRDATGRAIPFARRSLRTAGAAKGKGKKSKPKLTFGLFDYIFPVRGKHTYGDGIGAPRGDHTHQGQDISAPCGAKLVAAQGGTVTVNAYQASGAGYYLVIDTIGGNDQVYMHMAYASALTVGTVVRTGQTIGQVGTTGSSSGCHLHFEMWSTPGWFSGGSLVDPTPLMRAWDKYS